MTWDRPKFWPKLRLFCRDQIFRNRKRYFFFQDQIFQNWNQDFFFQVQVFWNRNPPKNGKNLETKEFRTTCHTLVYMLILIIEGFSLYITLRRLRVAEVGSLSARAQMARNCKFANLIQYNMQYIPCNSALLAQKNIVVVPKKAPFCPRSPKKSIKRDKS